MAKTWAISGYQDQNVVEMMLDQYPNWRYLRGGVKDADVVIFTGGADILPQWYGETGITGCYYSPMRDYGEVEDFRSMVPEQQAWGICRGAQLTWALSGGKLWQNVSDHAGQKHDTVDAETGGNRVVNSVHHQMLMPIEMFAAPGSPVQKAQVLSYTRRARAKEGRLNNEYIRWVRNEENSDSIQGLDIEAVVIPATETTPLVLGFQAHPEYGFEPCTEYFFELAKRYA